MDKAVEKEMNYIPHITHPLGKHWQQPDPSSIIIQPVLALLTEQAFKDLHEYSCSQPSGVYEGKMWKGEWIRFDGYGRVVEHTGSWSLRWFGYSDEPGMVSGNSRRICIMDYQLEFEVEL